MFTVNKYKLNKLKKCDVKIIGEIVDEKYGVKLMKNGKKFDLKNGFDHFKDGVFSTY